MKIKLNEDRRISGAEHKAGEVVEVHESLGQRMILNGIASRATVERFDAEDLEAMKKDELIAYAEERGIEVKSGMTKAEIIEAIGGSEG